MRFIAIGPRRDDGQRAGMEDGVVEVLGIIGPVGCNGGTGDTLDQHCAEWHLAAIAGTSVDTDRVSEAVCRRMKLGA